MSYADFVASIAKPGADILSALTSEKAQLWHGATGVAGEAGEFLDAVKKHVVYNKPLDRENAIEELGDLEYFLEHVRQLLGVTRDETIAANVAKLRKRYPEGTYTDAQAQARADKSDV